jgi:hypothetical protein
MLDRERDDADLRGDVLQALMLDRLVPLTVDAKVRAGIVTLTGTGPGISNQPGKSRELTSGAPWR